MITAHVRSQGSGEGFADFTQQRNAESFIRSAKHQVSELSLSLTLSYLSDSPSTCSPHFPHPSSLPHLSLFSPSSLPPGHLQFAGHSQDIRKCSKSILYHAIPRPVPILSFLYAPIFPFLHTPILPHFHLHSSILPSLILPQGPLLKPHIPLLVPTLLESLSSLEPQVRDEQTYTCNTPPHTSPPLTPSHPHSLPGAQHHRSPSHWRGRGSGEAGQPEGSCLQILTHDGGCPTGTMMSYLVGWHGNVWE